MRTVYVAECHTCHSTERFDTYQERSDWVVEHSLISMHVMGRSIPMDHDIQKHQQDWYGNVK